MTGRAYCLRPALTGEEPPRELEEKRGCLLCRHVEVAPRGGLDRAAVRYVISRNPGSAGLGHQARTNADEAWLESGPDAPPRSNSSIECEARCDW